MSLESDIDKRSHGCFAPRRKHGWIGLASWASLVACVSPLQLAAQSTPEPAAGMDAAPTSSPVEEEKESIDEVVVASRRPQIGAVIGDIRPELQISPAVIQSYGVSSVTQLLDEIGPLTGSTPAGRGRGIIVLLNGRRISGLNEVRDIPAEAILRVDILPEEAALKYGYAPDQPVVNVVLRRRFRAISGELQGQGASDGGDLGGQAEADLFRTRGASRLNLDLKYQKVTAVTEAQRDLIPFPGTHPYDVTGNVVSPVSGAEIDPTLSALAGQPVTIAGVPAGAAGSLTLADFGPTSGVANTGDDGQFRTVAPATSTANANLVLTHPLSDKISATLNLTLADSQAESERGLPGVRLFVPAGNPFSPFGSNVEVDRFAADSGPLLRTTDTRTGHLAGHLDRDISQWRLSAIASFDHDDVLTRSDVGVEASSVQALLLQKSTLFDPFASPLDLAMLPADEARLRTDLTDVTLVAGGPLFSLPAGEVFASFRLGDADGWLTSKSVSRSGLQSDALSRNDLGSRGSLDFPLTTRSSVLGELWLNVNGAVDQVTRFGTLANLGYGLNWSPLDRTTLIVSRIAEKSAPTLEQLGSPTLVSDRTHVLDFPTGETVDVHRIDGGNPDLRAEDRSVLKVALKVKPSASRNLVLSARYLDTHIDNPIATLPGALTDVQQAFPERFVRDSTGRLLEIDDRPANFASERRRELRWGFNFALPFGPTPPPHAELAIPGGASASEHGRDEGDRTSTSGGKSRRSSRRRSNQLEGGRLQFALYHAIAFEDRLLLRPGGPGIDLLSQVPTAIAGARPRQELEAQVGVIRNGLGARLSADWRSGGCAQDASGLPAANLTYSGIAKIDFRLFANFDGRPALVAQQPWLRGLRLTLSVTNLFDQRMTVRDQYGATPLSLQPAYLDPLGRVVRLSFRKLVF